MKTAFSTILIILVGFPTLCQNTNKAANNESLEGMERSYTKKRNGMLNSSNKELEGEQQDELDSIVDEMKTVNEESFEYNLTAYINSNYSSSKKENLLKAYQLRPESSKVHMELLAMHTIEGNRSKQIEFAKKLKGQYSVNKLNYFRDALPNENAGFMLVSNKADAYPIYVLQLIHNEKSAVNIITLDFLKNDDYRTEVQRLTGIGMTEFVGNEKGFISKLLSVSNKDIYVSATVNQNYLSRVAEGTFLTGLCYEWDVKDQKGDLEKFWQKVKKKDLSKITLSNSHDRRLYGNYLPPLLTLYKLKKINNEPDIVLRSTIEALATKINKSEPVKDILIQYDMD